MVIYGEDGLPLTISHSEEIYKNMKDPLFLRRYYRLKIAETLRGGGIGGSSPTDLFIGRYGYPNVYAGPLVPPLFGDTSKLGTPEEWREMQISDIVEMRSNLVRGMELLKVGDVEKGGMADKIRELALASKPVEAEFEFARKPYVEQVRGDDIEPFGPSAMMKRFRLGNVKADRRMERMHYDTGASSTTALVELYKKGVLVSQLQRALSAGLFGLKGKRKFVPTRWSITAVDDTLSKGNLSLVKQNEAVDGIKAFYSSALDNRWLIFFFPGGWEYESIEAWYPNTSWNEGNGIEISSSYEPYGGRKKYAEIGGCYYAARLAVSEKLTAMKKQARVLILREVHEGYIMPVGVCNVREHVRETLQTKPIEIDSMEGAYKMIKAKLEIPRDEWFAQSRILRDTARQRRIGDSCT